MPNRIRPKSSMYLLIPTEQMSAPITKIMLDTMIIRRRPYMSDSIPAINALTPAMP